MNHILIVGARPWQDTWALDHILEALVPETVVWHWANPRSGVAAMVQERAPRHGLAVARFPHDMPGIERLPTSQRVVAGLMRMDSMYVLGSVQGDRPTQALIRQARQNGVRIVRVTAITGLA